MLKTALHEWHVAASARMVDFAGWDMPIQYTSISNEHLAVREHVGLFDIAHMGRLIFQGPQAVDLLDHLLTNDVTKLQPGSVRYSLICNEQGGILDDVLIYRIDASRYLLVVNASNRKKILDWITAHSSGFDAEMQDHTLETFMLAVQGPRSAELLSSIVHSDLDGMKYYSVVETEADGRNAMVSRTGYTGEDGFELIVSNSDGPELWDRILETGKPLGAVPCGLGCRDTLRLEAAMPLYGHELDESIDPFTAGLDFAVKLQAGDFIGKAALIAKQADPDRLRRIGLVLEGRRIAREGAPVLSEAGPIGQVTSGTFSPTLQTSIAMAYVPAADSEPGRDLSVDIRGKRTPAKVVPLPFYKRS